MPVLWRCWVGGRNGIRPVKNWVVECCRGYLAGAQCRLAYGPADATATHYLLLQDTVIQIGFTFLVPDHSGSSGQRTSNGCVCVCVCGVTETAVHYYLTQVMQYIFTVWHRYALQDVFICHSLANRVCRSSDSVRCWSSKHAQNRLALRISVYSSNSRSLTCVCILHRPLKIF